MHRSQIAVVASALLLLSAGAAVAQEAMANDFIGKFNAWIVLDLRFALATAEGRTTYAYADDAPLTATCTGACAEKWPPVLANPQDVAFEPFAIFARKDGARQWAYQGAPLYTSALDTRPGQANGHGINDRWHFVAVPAHSMQ